LRKFTLLALIQDLLSSGWEVISLPLMFNQLHGSLEARITQMQQEIYMVKWEIGN
jgi:hypothetical protein